MGVRVAEDRVDPLAGLTLVTAKRGRGLALLLLRRLAVCAAIGGAGVAGEVVELGEGRGRARESARSRLA